MNENIQKLFEDYFSELQADMVSICLEYVNEQAEEIYIYCSYEDDTYSTGFFYKINGKMVKRHKISEELPDCDDSRDMQRRVLRILMDDLEKLQGICKEYDKPMPCEMKLTYNVVVNRLDTKCKYEPVYSFKNDLTADDIEKAWFKELEKRL